VPDGVWEPSGRIQYVEYWVGGQKVSEVPEGSEVEVRVVFSIATPATYEVAIQVDDREKLWSGKMTITEPGWYYIPFRFVERGPAGTYPLRVWLYGWGRELDRREFTYTVREATEEEKEEQQEQLPWYERSFMGLPVWAWIGLAGAFSVTAAVVGAVIAEERRRELMYLALLAR